MDTITIPSTFNYIGVFLTFKCNMNCSYCINKYDVICKRGNMPAKDWIKGLNRIVTRPDLPITLSGGEPTLHEGFYNIIDNIDKSTNIDILTNGMFNVNEFKSKVPPERLKRKSPYASIRVSYHPGYHEPTVLLERVRYLHNLAYSVGIWAVDHPEFETHIRDIQKIAAKMYGIDFRLKEFLGEYEGKVYGSYKYPFAVKGNTACKICKTSELLIAPDGKLFRCHRDLYANEYALGHILDKDAGAYFDKYYTCTKCGQCNPCDIKTKYDRFQKEGHCAVTIKELGSETALEPKGVNG